MPVLTPTKNWKINVLTIPGLGVIRRPPKGVPLIVGDREALYLVNNNLASIVIEDESIEEPSTEDNIKIKLLNFFNNASPNEIASVKGIGAKKIEEIIQSRPFKWEELQTIVSERVLDSVKSNFSS